MTATFATAEAKARLSELVNRVVYGDERVVIMRRGKPVAALVSVEDLHRLEKPDAETATQEAEAAPRDVRTIHPIMRAFGGWADRTDLDELVEEIYADREAALGREVAL